MVDLHSHIIPGIDDGAKTMTDAVAMCRMAADDGVDTMVATPHRFDGVYDNLPAAELRRRLAAVQEAVGPVPRLVLGCELLFGHDIVEKLCETREALPINDGPYVLIEFPSTGIPLHCEPTLYNVASAGFKPLIAHPERNRHVQERPDRFYNLTELGLFVQIDGASLLGKFGPSAEATARVLLQCNLVHAIGSDTHSPRRRRPGISRARDVAASIVGAEAAAAYVDSNPRAIVEGERVPFAPDPIPPRHRRRWFLF